MYPNTPAITIYHSGGPIACTTYVLAVIFNFITAISPCCFTMFYMCNRCKPLPTNPSRTWTTHPQPYNVSTTCFTMPTILHTLFRPHIFNKNWLPLCQLLLLSNQQAERLPFWQTVMSLHPLWWNSRMPVMISLKQNQFLRTNKSLSFCLGLETCTSETGSLLTIPLSLPFLSQLLCPNFARSISDLPPTTLSPLTLQTGHS